MEFKFLNSRKQSVALRDSIINNLEFAMNEGVAQVQDITEAGGSFDEFKQFVKLAQDIAVMIECS